jgi:carbamoyltransferase
MRILGYSGLDGAVRFKRRHLPSLSDREHRIVQGLDAAAALVRGGRVEFALAEERCTREKTTGDFPVRAIRHCLEHCGMTMRDVDFVAHGFDYHAARPLFDYDAVSAALYDEVYAPERQIALFERHFPGSESHTKFVPVPHHLAHASSAFFQSGFAESLIVVSDAMGETHSATVLVGSGPRLTVLAQIPALHSLGVLYSVFTLYLGFQFNMDEYKVMGLAPYGDARRYFGQIMAMVQLEADGTYLVPMLAEDRTPEERHAHLGVRRALAERFGPPRVPESAIEQCHADLAAALQAVLQTCQLHVLRHFRTVTGLRTLCLAGGMALNCTANGVVRRSRLFRDMFVQPASGDDGTALGAALYVQRQHEPATPPSEAALPLWGPAFDAAAVARTLAPRDDCCTVHYGDFAELARAAAGRLAAGQILGWFQGRMEFGPRALGSRSILADPRPTGMRERLNRLVKQREDFRPFAPAVVAEAAAEYFEIERGDERLYAHMLFVMPVREPYRAQLPAITHVDGTARLQTVARESDPRFWSVLDEFGRLTGIPVLLNTSFNVRGQPIVCTPAEAVDTFFTANLDALVIGEYLVTRAAS